MNVFVLNCGRCGSTTFIAACRHITNFSCAHESRTGLIGAARLEYPDNHIEADNRLSWFLGRLEQAYGDRAIYVHLTRNVADTARSFTRRTDFGIMRAYREAILMGCPPDSDPMALALDYYQTVNTNIETFLKGKSRTMAFRLEHARDDFEIFWDLIGAEGAISASLAEWDIAYNASA